MFSLFNRKKKLKEKELHLKLLIEDINRQCELYERLKDSKKSNESPFAHKTPESLNW